MEVYDPATQSWSFGPTLSVPRANVSVAVIRKRLYAVGGFSGKAFLDTMEYLHQETGQTEWCTFVPNKNRIEDAVVEEGEVEEGQGEAKALKDNIAAAACSGDQETVLTNGNQTS